MKLDPAHVYMMGDTDLDGDVDSDDLGSLLARFRSRPSNRNPNLWENGDLNGDQMFDSKDLGLLLANFGHTSGETSATIASAIDTDDRANAVATDTIDTRAKKFNAFREGRPHYVTEFVFSRFGDDRNDD